MNDIIEYWKDRFKNQGCGYVANRHLKNYSKQLELCQSYVYPFLVTKNKFAHCLDFGCGIGRFHDFLSTRVHRITSLDIFPEVLKRVKEKYGGDTCLWNIPKIDYPVKYPYEDSEVNVDIKCEPFNINYKFDLIWSAMTLQHIMHKNILDKACKELRKVSINNATFILIENALNETGHVALRSSEDYLNKLNLTPIKVEKINLDKPESHWLIIGTKNG